MEGFSEKFEERLMNTPVPIDLLIQELRSKELFLHRHADVERFGDERFKGMNKIVKEQSDLIPVIEGFLRASGIHAITSPEDIRNLLKTFNEKMANSLSEKQKSRVKKILFDAILERKANKFVMELPREEFEKQRELAWKDVEETEDSDELTEEVSKPSLLDSPEILRLYQDMRDEEARNAGAVVIDRNDEYNYMEVDMISDRVKTRLYDLFIEFI